MCLLQNVWFQGVHGATFNGHSDSVVWTTCMQALLAQWWPIRETGWEKFPQAFPLLPLLQEGHTPSTHLLVWVCLQSAKWPRLKHACENQKVIPPGVGDDSESYRGPRRLVFKKDDRNKDEASERAESRRGWALCFQQLDKHYWWSCTRTGRILLLQNKRLPKDRKCHLPQMQLWNITY